MYKKVLLAYDGSIEGRLALREGAKLAQFCGAEVFLLAVVETASSVATLEGGVVISMDEQIATYKAILAEGVERLKTHGLFTDGTAGHGRRRTGDRWGSRRDRSKPRRCGPSSQLTAGSLAVRLCRNLLGQTSPLQCPGRSDRD